MTNEEKAKAYDEALEIAKNEINIKGIGETVELCERLFPELRESEDERIIKGLLSAFCDMKANYWIGMEVPKIVAWLEKQKENSKSVDSISSDCVSDAKCEDRWHKVGDSLPDSTREVLCKDAIGNYFIGRYYSKGVWEVSMYDDCDKSNEDNPPVVMWIDIPSEKQKEHLVDNSKTSADEDERIRKGLVNFLQSPFIKENLTDEKVAPWVAYLERQKEQKPSTPKYRVGDVMRTKQESAEGITDGLPVIVSVDDNYYYCTNEKIPISEQEEYEFPPMNMRWKPAEWSEDDELMILTIIQTLETFGGRGTTEMQINWLKSLRPQPHWKPSEGQLKAMEEVRRIFHNHHLWDEINPILYDYEELMRDLQKLI